MSTKATPATPSAAPRGRGRPPIIRDRSQINELARLRKQKQRERASDAGMVRIEIELPSDALGSLAFVAALAGTEAKPLASWLVKGALGPFRREIEALENQAGALWLKATPYMRYASYLTKPGSSFRVHERTLTHADWQPLEAEIAAIHGKLTRWGWTKGRIDRFFRRSAERVSLRVREAANKK